VKSNRIPEIKKQIQQSQTVLGMEDEIDRMSYGHHAFSPGNGVLRQILRNQITILGELQRITRLDDE
jgi:hypothetical protein